MEQMTSICDMVGQYMQKKEEDKRIAEDQAAKDRYWKIPICYDDDDDEESSIPIKDIIISGLPPCVSIIPVLLTEEPVDSLIMEDEHLDTIPATESDEVIKSSVENLVSILSKSEGISDGVCDMPLCNNPTPLEAFKKHSEACVDFNDDSTLSDDDSPYGEDIDYVDASPPDAEIVSLELVKIVIPKVRGIDTDILLTIKDDIFQPRVHVPNVLPTHSTLHLDSDFTLSSDSLGSDLVVSFPSGTRNKIFDLGIFIKVQSIIFLSLDEFSFSFIRDPPLLVIDTLLPFSFENENKVFNTGYFASKEKISSFFIHIGAFKASMLFIMKARVLIHGDNTPNLDVRHPHFYPP
ncbi:hypothetical protein Tco_0057606 [Tanacetum coccineum]